MNEVKCFQIFIGHVSLSLIILFMIFAQFSDGGWSVFFLFLKALYILNILTLCHIYHRNFSKFVIYLNFLMVFKFKKVYIQVY